MERTLPVLRGRRVGESTGLRLAAAYSRRQDVKVVEVEDASSERSGAPEETGADSRITVMGDEEFEEDAQGCEELVVGLVAALGTNLDLVVDAIEDAFAEFSYDTELVRLSDFLSGEAVEGLVTEVDDSTEYARVKSLMQAGDDLRAKTSDDIVAQRTVDELRTRRPRSSEGDRKPFGRQVHILRSLKRPEEVFFLRRVYGSRLLLIGVFVPEEERALSLKSRGLDEQQVAELIKRDEAGGTHGQATARTFELADLFLDGSRGRERASREVQRFLDLVFGSPLVTPTKDEHVMFLAFSASLRSGDLSRQVGAVVATKRGAVIGEGANDAPRFGGGQYWPEDGDDQRDIVRGYDSNELIKRQMIEKVAAAPEFAGGADSNGRAREVLKAAGFLDITEFGRAVHAEMAALMSCARLGVSAKDRLLYCTTFPCHNCAKHIVAAGICEVVFIEPYPKSRALQLHSDAVGLGVECGKVRFRPFTGIGPRRYVELFALRDQYSRSVRRKDDGGRLVKWRRVRARPALPDHQITYLDRETWVVGKLGGLLREALEQVGRERPEPPLEPRR